ncbi:MAG: UDP-N-acetylmuramoyl-tripeptide--D-alanyl-D-alanine ligase [Nitrospirales bacterium]|nr:UDP-N-acetylmuramoyl-tripeptide--D-alanyl-D-alanine ligase [Nitrospirales bacterium]
MPLFTTDELLTVTGGVLWSDFSKRQVRRLSTDSRILKPGDLFIALMGDSFDGHQFVTHAIGQGARGAIVQRSVCKNPRSILRATRKRHKDFLLIGVDDTLRAYQDLAGHHRRKFALPVVAVTGSNGKTTTKDMIANVLRQHGYVLKTQGNLNNSIGLPHTLLRLTARHDMAVIELGVDQEGQTTRLCEIARPTHGVITNIGPDHLEGFGSLDGSARAKAELLSCLPNDGVIVLNGDDQYFNAFQQQTRCPLVSFGFSSQAAVWADRMISERMRTTFRVHLPQRVRSSPMSVEAQGVHNVANALAAIAMGYSFGMSPAKIATGLGKFRPAAMRSHILRVQGMTVIQDCYNANPASMKAAIDLLMERAGHKRAIAVLGDMLELGKSARRFHVEIGKYLAQHGVAHLIACGDWGKDLAAGARTAGLPASSIHVVNTAMMASPILRGLAQCGDVILVKASRGMQLERVVSGISEWGTVTTY